MKKQFSEISGVLLTSKEMKELKGGALIGVGPKPCDGQECPIFGGTSCATIAVGGCWCSKASSSTDTVAREQCKATTVKKDTSTVG